MWEVFNIQMFNQSLLLSLAAVVGAFAPFAIMSSGWEVGSLFALALLIAIISPMVAVLVFLQNRKGPHSRQLLVCLIFCLIGILFTVSKFVNG